MPRPYPQEFRDDVVRVALARDAGVTLEQIATDFKIHPMTLSNWISKHHDNTATPTTAGTDPAERLREANRRIKLLEQENEVLRRAAAYLSQANLAPKGSSRS
jgi:transposase-like protein